MIVSLRFLAILSASLLHLPPLALAGVQHSKIKPGEVQPAEFPPDGPSNSKFAGMGLELELIRGHLESTVEDCSSLDIIQVKRGNFSLKTSKKGDAGEQRGHGWRLTADIPQVTFEYIIDGQEVPIGEGKVVKVMSEVVRHMRSLPLGDQNDIVEYGDIDYYIGTSRCNPWRVAAVGALKNNELTTIGRSDLARAPFNRDLMIWKPQATFAVGWSRMWDVFKECRTFGPKYRLIIPDNKFSRRFCIFVSPGYFKTSPLGITPESIREKKDALGFLSLLLRFAKASTDSLAQFPAHSAGFKNVNSFALRTEWRTNWNLVKHELPQVTGAKGKTLYDLVKVLACYKSLGGNLPVLDGNYCIEKRGGGIKILDTLDNNKWTVYEPKTKTTKERVLDELFAKYWINSITDPHWKGPDAYAQFEKKWFRGSIGGYGSRLEPVLKSGKLAPLWEYRGMAQVMTDGLESLAEDLEQVSIELQSDDGLS